MAWKEQTGQHAWRVRYQRNGEVVTITGFTTEQDANHYILDMQSDQRRGRWIDPADSRMPLGEWAARWMETLDLEPRTIENYQSLLRNHILPRWHECPIGAITALDVALWRKKLRVHHAASTVDGITCLFSMMLEDAVDQRMIEANPVHRKRRRGRRRDRVPSRLEKVWGLPEHVVRIAAQAGMLGGPDAELLVITTGWTGCRWGEMAGLQKDHVLLDRGVIVIDPEVGALHESAHGMWLGPPKTPSSAREIQLPPFLIDLLRKHLAHHPGQFVFTAPQGGWLRRSDFNRRVFRPAVEGDPRRGLVPVRPGLTFHGLRHSHKTWLATAHTPAIASAKRLGHHVPDRLEEVYTHVAPKMERDILTTLQRLWRHSHHAALRPMDNRPQSRRDKPTPAGHRHHAPTRPTQADQRQASPPADTATPAHRSRSAAARSASSRSASHSALRAHHKVARTTGTQHHQRPRNAAHAATPRDPHTAKGGESSSEFLHHCAHPRSTSTQNQNHRAHKKIPQNRTFT